MEGEAVHLRAEGLADLGSGHLHAGQQPRPRQVHSVCVGGQDGRVLVGIPGRLVLRPGQVQSGQAAEALGQARSEEPDILVGRRRQRLEPEPIPAPLHEQPVGVQAMEVRVCVEDAAEALDERNRAGAAVRNTGSPPPQPLPREQGAKKRPKHLREEGPIHSKHEAQLPREGQHPLAVRGLWEEPIHEVRCDVRSLP